MKLASRSRVRFLSALVVASVLLAGCGGSGPGAGGFTAVLPRIIVDVAPDGTPSVGSINPLILKLAGLDPNQFKLDPATVKQLTESNVQHVELLFRQDGLYWWVNSKALIPLVWDDASFNNVTQLVPKFVQIDEAQKGALINVFLPAARRLEANIAVKFPLKGGAAEVPLREMHGVLPEAGKPTTPSTVIRFQGSFDAEGQPTALGGPVKDVTKVLGMAPNAVAIPKDTVTQMVGAGIQHVTIRTTPEGLKLWTNDQPLPTLRWSDDTLKSTADVVAGLTMLPKGADKVAIAFVPFLNTVDANIVLKFPAAGTAIPLP